MLKPKGFTLKSLNRTYALIEQLQAKVAEQQAEVERLKREDFSHERVQNDSYKLANRVLQEQLAASQLSDKQLQEDLKVITRDVNARARLKDVGTWETEAAVLEAVVRRIKLVPVASTEALDAYVAEKVKEALRNQFDMEMDSLARQRDLAVEVAKDAITSLETISIRSFGKESYLDSKEQMRGYAGTRARVATETLSAIKESKV